MMTTEFLLSAVKSKLCIDSDYRLAKALEINKNTVSAYRHRNINLGEHASTMVARLLNVPLHPIYVAMMVERAQNDASRFAWMQIYEMVGGPEVEEFIRKTCFRWERAVA
ncbi:hypothetical protein HNQ50_001390 [Silvimonas terrae]|uniref:Uncharacterized protein n=1 Tax=Silvimonas terrae TaxID=300266 RepID=A0A840RDR4_9NEIS|nr:hypothetical protein [Silvimonas terrae]MBB5190668.1 hypothetical protein [Silvimonas terrae]